MSFQIRRATLADRPAIEATLAEYLPGDDPRARYDWLYLGNPHGRALTWLVHDEQSGEVAGMTSFFLRQLLVAGKPALGALGGDGYVRPKFRRRGIGNRMHAASRADMRTEGIAVMFGTPMPANLTPLEKAGARTIGETIRFVRPLAIDHGGLFGRIGSKLLAPLFRFATGHARLEPLRADDRRVDEIWAATAPELPIATIRDAAFYEWRFLRAPSKKQTPYLVLEGNRAIAACALEVVGDDLRIVDLVAPRRAWSRALSAIVRMAGDANGLELKLVREDGEARQVWRYGFFPRGSKPLNLLLPEGSTQAATFYDPARWFFTWAEADMDHS